MGRRFRFAQPSVQNSEAGGSLGSGGGGESSKETITSLIQAALRKTDPCQMLAFSAELNAIIEVSPVNSGGQCLVKKEPAGVGDSSNPSVDRTAGSRSLLRGAEEGDCSVRDLRTTLVGKGQPATSGNLFAELGLLWALLWNEGLGGSLAVPSIFRVPESRRFWVEIGCLRAGRQDVICCEAGRFLVRTWVCRRDTTVTEQSLARWLQPR
ncbi:uncharacterized protein B0H64DRAFT_196279 [Chaetomium fimeti]|jgi:hypothetical protein|uniref:Uncharacterized protein n=1 Tax=Chaetomium fimeti TaxID=1854472 RepID=A0AAE0HE84_9PEZI|nr:hypothetical protein B0H64DRAFT_196279 [Chaetomium fimeti]